MNFGLLDEEIGTNEDELHQFLPELVYSVICVSCPCILARYPCSLSILLCMQTGTSHVPASIALYRSLLPLTALVRGIGTELLNDSHTSFCHIHSGIICH
jgi:hypothetical protein